jgi:hypothetical protein
MNVKKHVYNFLKRKNINEGFTDEGEHDIKYYAFDWDDNIMFMPTKIILLSENDDEIEMSTEDFAEHRHQIGVEPFPFKGTTIVGYASDPFRYFGVQGDKRFIIDCMVAPLGPSWNDFVECINGGSIFAIITARGHTPSVLREGVMNLIMGNKNGINSKTVIENLKKYEDILKEVNGEPIDLESEYDGKDLINRYLDRCMFAPVSYGQGSASSPEEGKINAMREFITHCKVVANEIRRNGKFKNDVANEEIIPFIGFSDDDPRNIDTMNQFLEKEYEEKPVRTYLTKGGYKTEV